MAQENTVILRVALDEGKTEEQLQKLVLDIEATRKAQAALTAERKAGTVTDEEFTKRTIDLQTKLKGQQGEQTALTRNLNAYRSAMASATDSVDQLKAQSALLTAQYNAMSKEGRENTEAGRELTAQLDATNKALLAAGQAVNDNRRNVGNYSASLKQAIQDSGFFGGITAKVTQAQETFSKAQVIAKAAIGGNVTALGFLRLALLATGLGALVVVLGSVVAFLTKSQTGIDLVNRKLAGLKAIVSLVIGVASEFGETLFKAFDNPKQALSDLVEFIEGNLLNRLKALGTIIAGIQDRSLSKITEGLFVLGTGIVDADKKLAAFAATARVAQLAGESIEAENQRILRAERALNVERSQSRAQIEALKKLSDDSTQSVATRTAAAKEAAAIENGLLAEQLKLQDDKIRNTIREANLDKQQTNEELDAIAELRSARAETQQESLTLQTELQNKINSLVQEGYDKTIAGRAQALALEKALIEKQLAQVRVNSDEELALLQRKLANGRAAELNVKNLTVAQKKAIDVKYEQDSLALSLDFNRKRMLAALQSQADLTTAELAGQQAGSARALQLQVQQIEEQRRLALAALNANADNAAAIEKINAQATQQRTAAEYAATEQALEDYLEGNRQIVERDYATGKIGENLRIKQINALEQAGYKAALINAQDYGQDRARLLKAQADLEIREATRVKDEKAKIEDIKKKIQDDAFQAAATTTDLIIENFGRESSAGQVALVAKKTFALAQVAIDTEKVLIANGETAANIANEYPYIGPALAAAYLVAADAAAIAAAASAVSNISKYQQGGLARVGGGMIAQGPSHAHGGIQLYHRGQHAGIEIEGMEPVLTANVTRNPLLLSLASTVNQLAGGRALMPNFPTPRMALGGVAPALVLDRLRGGGAPLVIEYDKLARALTSVHLSVGVRDIQAATQREAFTKQNANS